MLMKKEIKHKVVPKWRFAEFQADGDWNEPTLFELSDRIEEKVGQRLLTTVSISAGIGFVSQAEKFSRDISGQQYKNYILLRKGDFAYNKGNSKKYPQGCVYKLKEFEEVAAPNAFICFRFKKNVVADFFIGYFDNNFHGKQIQKFITSGARMDGLLNISADNFFSIILPTPKNKTEQQKIASCLSSIDDLITAHTQKLDALKAHKKGLIQQLFPAEGEKVPKLRFEEFKDSGEWEEKTLSQVADYENGKAHEQDIVESGSFIVVNSKFISTEGEVKKFTNTAFCLAKKGDVLMVLSDVPNGKAIGKCFFVDADDYYSVNQRVCRITPLDTNGLLLFYLLDRNEYFLSFDDGVKQTNLRKDEVLDCPLLLPKDPKEQQKIADCLSAIDELITAQVEEIEQLKNHKKGLMQGLFPVINETN